MDDADDDDVSLRTLLGRLSRDAVQLVHDELELAKLELRDVADTLSEDVREAGHTFARDVGRIFIAVSLAFLAALALTAGMILGLGTLMDGAYWAGGLIVGVILAVAAVLFVHSAMQDLRESAGVRFENTMRTLRRDGGVLREEARGTGEFAQRNARTFARHRRGGNATRPRLH